MKNLSILLLFSLVMSTQAMALQFAKVFSNNMVLQQQQTVPVWGTAAANSKVKVIFLDQTHITTASNTGHWKVKLSPLHASYMPAQLTVEVIESDIKSTAIVNNVLVGEVWLSSGQSNMRLTVAESATYLAKERQQYNPNIRLLDFTNKTFYPTERVFDVKELEHLVPANYFESCGWQVNGLSKAKSFSAVAYYFADKLQRELDVPVGIINVAVGGSLTESFISNEKLASIPLLAKLNDYWLAHIPSWCATRAEYNLSAWRSKYPYTLPNHPFKPGFIFESGIRPLIPFAIKGVLWYQGESNAPISHLDSKNALLAYQGEFSLELSKTKLKALILDWREKWHRDTLPFYIVQLPGLNRPWAPYRHMQLAVTKEIANTAIAVTYDIGEPTDVHPKNKKTVGLRLAKLALFNDYSKRLVASGPVFSHIKRLQSSLKVFFKESHQSNLMILDDSATLKGFEIAGADAVFKSAQAIIKDNHVFVSHPSILAPKMVRYAWFDDPKDKANLGNQANLPATPFNSFYTGPEL